jgi:hypothetical protein
MARLCRRIRCRCIGFGRVLSTLRIIRIIHSCITHAKFRVAFACPLSKKDESTRNMQPTKALLALLRKALIAQSISEWGQVDPLASQRALSYT